MGMLEDYQRALGEAAQKGDTEAYNYFKQKVSFHEANRPETYSATEGMGTGEKLAAGLAQGVANTGRMVGNLVGLVSDEDLAQSRKLDEALLDTGAGQIGSFIGEAAATAPIGGVGGFAAKQAGGQVLKQALKSTAKMGALQGGLEGAVMAGPGTENRLMGAALGATGGAALPYVGGKVARGAMRGVDPGAGAKQLMREGADLTPGQMNPTGRFNQMEESMQGLPVVGSMIGDARQNAIEGWQRSVARQGAAPGANPKTSGTVQGAYDSFEPAYDVAKDFPIYPKIMNTVGGDEVLANWGKQPKNRGALSKAVNARSTMADDATRKKVDSWLQNKITQLPGKGRSLTTSDDILKLRSDVRAQARAMRSGATPDTAAAELLENAERKLTEVLDSQLPPDVRQALKAADKQYAQYKIVEDASRRAGDQVTGMTPSNLSQAVKAATDRGTYARGGGGPLRQSARAAKDAFTQRAPPTGQRMLTLAPPAALAAAEPTLAAIMGAGTLGMITSKTGRKVAGGMTKAQQKAQRAAAALRRKAGREGRYAGRALGSAAGAGAAREIYPPEY